ncbi:hypothetical protein GCM10009116_11970 [Brevundimonas basaltis]
MFSDDWATSGGVEGTTASATINIRDSKLRRIRDRFGKRRPHSFIARRRPHHATLTKG